MWDGLWSADLTGVRGEGDKEPAFGRGSGRAGHWCHETDEWQAVVPAGTVVIVHYEL